LLVQLLVELTGSDTVYERSDVEVRALEGLLPRSGILSGREPDREVLIREDRLRYFVDVRQGHKTGFYLDQKVNRQKVGEFAAGKSVLDCFCYTGGFTISAKSGGAKSILAIDSSAPALSLAKRNLEINGLSADSIEFRSADVFQELRRLRDQAKQFGLIILDPPKFSPTAAQAQKAARAYKDINLLALKLLEPGGLLFTFSCSGGINADLFQKILASAAVDAQVEAKILEKLSQSPDHPIALSFPEGDYLKGLVIQKV
jgi:23S rRNA (cytosine1962-C5)-methyltransferase